VTIHVSKAGAIDEKIVKKALAGKKKLKVVAFKKVSGKSAQGD